VFAAERTGTIQLVGDQTGPSVMTSLANLFNAPGELLAIAVDPDFERTGSVYAVFASAFGASDKTFAIVRLREASDTLADPVVVLSGVPAGLQPRAALRFGPDGKLYALLGTADDPDRDAEASSMNAKLLRLNRDGTTPADQAGATPVFADGFASPAGVAWNAATGVIWLAGRSSRAFELRTVTTASRGQELRATTASQNALPAPTNPSAVVVYGAPRVPAFAGNVFIGSEEGAPLLRVRVDAATQKPVATERLLENRLDGIRALSVADDGVLYFATARTVGRLVPGAVQ
jgi:glucose/arabinose dehydrogenase